MGSKTQTHAKHATQGTNTTETYQSPQTYTFRVSGMGEVSLFNICAIFHELDLIKTWLPLCRVSEEIGAISKYTKCAYIRLGLFWPIKDRECILYGYAADDLVANDRLYVFFDSRESVHFTQYLPKDESSTGKVFRVDIHIGGFLFEYVDSKEGLTDTDTKTDGKSNGKTNTETKTGTDGKRDEKGERRDKTRIVCVFNCDPKASFLPYTVFNWFCGQFISTFLTMLITKARNIDTDLNSPYRERIKQKAEFYNNIKARIKKRVN